VHSSYFSNCWCKFFRIVLVKGDTREWSLLFFAPWCVLSSIGTFFRQEKEFRTLIKVFLISAAIFSIGALLSKDGWE
jgi:hypothetical protein